MTKQSTRFKCASCSFTCGRSKTFEKHLYDKHSFSSTEAAYIHEHLNNIVPLCVCNACDRKPTFRGWNKGFNKFIDGHNSNIYTAFSSEKAQEIIKKRSAALKGRKGWSRGLTKETNSSLMRASKNRSITAKQQFASGDRIPWNKGLTKETSKSVLEASQRLSNRYLDGSLVPWAKGKTKETDSRVLKMSHSVSTTMRKNDIRNRLDALKRLNTQEIIRRLSINAPDLELMTDISEYTRDRHINLEFKCKKCGHVQIKSFLSALSNRCVICDPSGSKHQIEIDRFVSSLGIRTELCDRSIIAPYEIDVYAASHSIGIEYNGLYFHSEVFKNKHYHADKSRMCAEKGIQLIHIFEDEWRNKKNVCKSMMIHKFGLTKNSVYARKCSIKVVSPAKRKEFFDHNHIDGDVRSKKALGLVTSDGEIVACISLRRPTHRKYKGMLEVARYCTKVYTHVPGGLSRLTKAALKYCAEINHYSLLTYVDTRHGTKNGYMAAGYQYKGVTSNRFWWTGGRERIDRFKIRADKLNHLSEKEVAEEHGVVKIWGCPNLIFTIT